MLKDFIRQSSPWTTYLRKMKLQNNIKLVKNCNFPKAQLSNKVIKEFYTKNSQLYININNKLK